MDKKSLLLGVLLGVIGGIFSSLIMGSFLVLIQNMQLDIVALSGIIFLIFLNSSLALVSFVIWAKGNLVT